MNEPMSEPITYRGYTITVGIAGPKNDLYYIGRAVCEGSKHSPLTSQEHAMPEAAVLELKGDIDYWLAPSWTRNLEAAQEHIKRLVAERDALLAISQKILKQHEGCAPGFGLFDRDTRDELRAAIAKAAPGKAGVEEGQR